MLPKPYPKTSLFMFCTTASLIFINFVSSILIHSVPPSTEVNSSIPNNPASLNTSRRMEKQAILKILDIFASTYVCNEDTKTAGKRESNSSSIPNDSQDKATPKKFYRICFPSNWPIAVYAASSTGESDYIGKEEEPSHRGGLQLRHVEGWTQNGHANEAGCGLVVVIDLYPLHKFGHPVVIYRARRNGYLDHGSYQSAEGNCSD